MPSWPSAVEPGVCYQFFRHLDWDSIVVLISLGESLVVISPEQCFGHLIVCLCKALGMMVRSKEEDEGGCHSPLDVWLDMKSFRLVTDSDISWMLPVVLEIIMSFSKVIILRANKNHSVL